MADILYIVVPCYNEEKVIEETTRQLSAKINNLIDQEKIDKASRILYVDDGSKDKTWHIVCDIFERNELVTGIKLSRNRGHQNALLAGLLEAAEHADMIVSMDADLQDDINVLDLFVEEYYKGNQIVYGVRQSRKKDSVFKRTTAIAFY